MSSAGPSPRRAACRAVRRRDSSRTLPGRSPPPPWARPYSIPPVRLGILGCGRAAREVHLPALTMVAQLDVVAAADPDPCRLHDVADRYLIQGRYTEDRELLANPAVEAVAVLVPLARLVMSVRSALEAGKDVCLMRPGLLGPAEAEEVAALAVARDRLIQVGLPLRWHRSVRGAEELLRSGALGPIHLVWSRVTVPAPGASGALFEAALEHLDLWRHLLGVEVEEISLGVPAGRSEAGDDSFTISATLTAGIRARAWFRAGGVVAATVGVRGERGRLSLECCDGGGLRLYGEAVERRGNGSRWPVPGVRGLVGALTRLTRGEVPLRKNGGALAEANREQWKAFGQSVLWRRPTPYPMGEVSGSLEVLHAGLRSLRSGGKPIPVPASGDLVPS